MREKIRGEGLPAEMKERKLGCERGRPKEERGKEGTRAGQGSG